LSLGSIGIFGLGAMGGSIGLRARRNGVRVFGANSSDSVLTQALEAGAIDARATVEELAGTVDSLILAAHLAPTISEIQRLGRVNVTASLIMDVASVKVPVAQAAIGLRNFVATHPMAGTERSGVSAARADLFEGCTWAYVPSGDSQLDERARSFIESMGAMPFAISAEEHDRAVALSSHVPQLIGSCYAELIASSDSAASQLCGPVARELLRISGMSFDMWREILRANSAPIVMELRSFGREIEKVADHLARGEVDSLAALFGD
jgi:prephenate dehydrogenase